jgi:DNA-binding transcriptional MerR regulator
MAQLQPYVLRTWESEFPTLGQPATGGARMYRRADVEMVLQIKQLVFGEGLTLAGARRRFEEEHSEPSVAAAGLDDMLDGMARSRLQEVRHGLEAIMKLLERDTTGRELQLVSPPAKTAAKNGNTKRRRAS